MADRDPIGELCADFRSRIRDLEDALVYSAFEQHSTPLHMLPKGITLIDANRVEVVLADGRKVTACDASGGTVDGV